MFNESIRTLVAIFARCPDGPLEMTLRQASCLAYELGAQSYSDSYIINSYGDLVLVSRSFFDEQGNDEYAHEMGCYLAGLAMWSDMDRPVPRDFFARNLDRKRRAALVVSHEVDLVSGLFGGIE